MQSIVSGHNQLMLRQVKEWGEILINFEGRNRFEIFSDDGEKVGYASEQGDGIGAVLLRNWLGAMRKASIRVADQEGREVGRIEKPFRWFFHRVDVFSEGTKVGAVERRWSWLHREYAVENAAGHEILRIVSPLFRIWTFELKDGDQTIGAIRKKWGGALREVFSDADTFGVEFPSAGMGDEVRKVLLGATFLIDFVHFENNSQRS